MLAEHTKMANGTKRATGETVDVKEDFQTTYRDTH
jgi:hypothetical protein